MDPVQEQVATGIFKTLLNQVKDRLAKPKERNLLLFNDEVTKELRNHKEKAFDPIYGKLEALSEKRLGVVLPATVLHEIYKRRSPTPFKDMQRYVVGRSNLVIPRKLGDPIRMVDKPQSDLLFFSTILLFIGVVLLVNGVFQYKANDLKTMKITIILGLAVAGPGLWGIGWPPKANAEALLNSLYGEDNRPDSEGDPT